ncbi:MFS transporter [Mycetocola tolaasinivorans]|uniref:MFS transporter n=2 Tax=Mycetocola tolaasinivorans TaxID=76635 RepID=A0A3L7ADS3_9MICO|nr:MFS transporter [Mycetocola tolaasinivorans]
MAVVASVSGLGVAQPQLALEFGIDQDRVLWIINAYTITLAALLLPLGALGDRLGRKTMLLAGTAVFTLANIAAALAPTADMILGARVAAGIGAAAIMPVTLSVITSSFPPAERSQAIGIWTGVAGGGGILGMYLSALLVDVAAWRWMFALPVVLLLASALLAVRSVPNTREAASGPFDVVGALTSMFAMVGFTLALHEGPARGWGDALPLGALIIAILAAAGFVWRELRHPAPLLNLRAFRTRGLSSGSLLLLVMFGVQAGISIVLYPFFQTVLGWSGLAATLGLMPMALLMMATSGIAPRLAARIGARATMATGVFVGAAGLALMAALVSRDGGYLTVLPGLIAMGAGMGLAMTPSTEAITSALPREQQGAASALNDVTRELGAALGVALLGALVTAGYRTALAPALSGLPTTLTAGVAEGIAGAGPLAASGDARAAALIRAAHEAFVFGWQQSMWIGAIILVLLGVIVMLRGPRARA